MRSLGTRVTVTTAKLLLVLAVALFAAAGTVRFWQAWLYLSLQLVTMGATNLYLLKHNRALLERRLTLEEQGEKEPTQKRVMALLRLFGLAMHVVAGLDRRFGWAPVPSAAVVAGGAVFVAGALVVFLVFRENTYASSIIEVGDRQTVVETGLYRLVRHPMYMGTVIMGMGTPLLLGSWWSGLFLLPGWILLGARILAEERFLAERLPGYRDYMGRTPHRLIPGVW